MEEVHLFDDHAPCDLCETQTDNPYYQESGSTVMTCSAKCKTRLREILRARDVRKEEGDIRSRNILGGMRWMGINNVAEGLVLEHSGRRASVYFAALERALRDAMIHGARLARDKADAEIMALNAKAAAYAIDTLVEQLQELDIIYDDTQSWKVL